MFVCMSKPKSWFCYMAYVFFFKEMLASCTSIANFETLLFEEQN